MTNRELLELAAKAAGHIGTVTEYPNGFAEMGLSNHCDQHGSNVWNPLISNGQALELAVKLRLSISIDDRPAGVVRAYVPDDRITAVDEPIKADAAAATRRAIVLAAAKLAAAPGASHD